MAPMSVLLQRARGSGKCPLSLLSDDRVYTVDDFDVNALRLLSPNAFCLRSDDSAANDFSILLQGLQNIGTLPSHVPTDSRRKVLEYRRAILLTLVAGTPSNNPALVGATSKLMVSARIWLDDALSNSTGSVDFLLHLLTSIEHLPVTKASIKDSGLGKAVGAVEKHKICKSSPHATAIVQRVERIKQAWHARVKSQKINESSSTETNELKRPIESSNTSPASVKKMKQVPLIEEKKITTITEEKKNLSFSNLLKKVAAPSSNGTSTSSNPASANKIAIANANLEKTKNNAPTSVSTIAATKKVEKKTGRRVKWADHFGGKLGVSKDEESDEHEAQQTVEANVSWSDRKRRDRLREKELLSKAKKAKLDDEVEDDGIDLANVMKAMIAWHTPLPLPDRPDIAKPSIESQELVAETQRIKSTMQAHYIIDENVPSNPTPLSTSEEEREATSQSSAVVSEIPFFVPQTTPAPEPVIATTNYTEHSQSFTAPTTIFPAAPSTSQYGNVATAELLQSLGLPMFLIGQATSAVQTLASSPGLLSTLVDAQGMYDQPRLLNLVHTLSASTGDMQRQHTVAPVVPTQYQPPISSFSAPAPAPTFMNDKSFPPTGTKSAPYPSSGGTRLVVDKSVEGNLHISGFGVGTTDADLIATFSPYVRIDEIVMKGTYAFVNTSDPPSAARAREALQGTHIRGAPITIKQATRKQKDPTAFAGPYGPSQPPLRSSSSQNHGNQLPQVSIPPTPHQIAPIAPAPVGMSPYGIVDVDAVRDDRGNPATKNLFIAGYGPSTTEQQLRDLVSQYALVVGVVLKGTFSFVNTVDREAAVYVRKMLSGTMLNGGVVRINFAKETGRLGTSFDLTYGPNTGPNALRNPAAPQLIPRPQETAMSYYGRGY